MLKPETMIATPDDARPAGRPGECFYCHAAVGTEHEPDCVVRSRTVVVDFTVRLVVTVPESWDKETIETMYWKPPGWCSNSLLGMIEEAEEANVAGAAVVRDATAEDEARYGVADRPPSRAADGE